MDIGKKIKELRILKGLTQEELADRAELTKGFISQVERNHTSPSIATLVDILQCLGTDLKNFFEDDEDAEPGKFEQFLDRVCGEKLESAIMAAVLVISFILAIGIFMLLPLGIANLFKGVITSDQLMSEIEGVIRIAIFIIYIKH